MHEVLFQYIEVKSEQKLTDEERQLIKSKFHPKHLRRRQYFLQAGEICTNVAFIVKGSSRMFSVDDSGHEHIVRFGLESWWLNDPESFISQTPSNYNIEMLEESDLLVISVTDAHELREKSRVFDLTIKAMDRQASVAMQKRVHASISMTAEERYNELASVYPQFLQRFPQNMIASYLGLSPETLSRVRKNAIGK
jgi:CRP-like cAMP-binding protein